MSKSDFLVLIVIVSAGFLGARYLQSAKVKNPVNNLNNQITSDDMGWNPYIKNSFNRSEGVIFT